MSKTSPKAQKFISGEISKLMKKGPSTGPLKGQKFKQKRAVAAALNVAREKGFDVPKKKDESTSPLDALLEASRKSIFDDLVTVESEPYSLDDPDRYVKAMTLAETLIAIKNRVTDRQD